MMTYLAQASHELVPPEVGLLPVLVSRAIRILRAYVEAHARRKGGGEKYIWCI